jgi:hypothetical protein
LNLRLSSRPNAMIVTIPDEVLGGDVTADTFAAQLLEQAQASFRGRSSGHVLRIVPRTERALYDEAVTTFVDLLRNTPATSAVVVLDMDRAIVRYHLHLSAETDVVYIKHLRVLETVTVHHMHYGAAPCAVDDARLRGVPGEWPPGHVWSGDWGDVTCPRCLALRAETI